MFCYAKLIFFPKLRALFWLILQKYQFSGLFFLKVCCYWTCFGYECQRSSSCFIHRSSFLQKLQLLYIANFTKTIVSQTFFLNAWRLWSSWFLVCESTMYHDELQVSFVFGFYLLWIKSLWTFFFKILFVWESN